MPEHKIRAIVPVCETCEQNYPDEIRTTAETGDESLPLACYFCSNPCEHYASVRVPDPAELYLIADELHLIFLLIGVILGAVAAWN